MIKINEEEDLDVFNPTHRSLLNLENWRDIHNRKPIQELKRDISVLRSKIDTLVKPTLDKENLTPKSKTKKQQKKKTPENDNAQSEESTTDSQFTNLIGKYYEYFNEFDSNTKFLLFLVVSFLGLYVLVSVSKSLFCKRGRKVIKRVVKKDI